MIFLVAVSVLKKCLQKAELRRKRRKRAAVTVRPLPVVTSRGCGGFKRRQLLLLLHPLVGRTEDTCEAAGQSSLKTEKTNEGRGKV